MTQNDPVVVTGMGITSCLGNTLEEVTDSLKEAKSGISYSKKYEELAIRSKKGQDVRCGT